VKIPGMTNLEEIDPADEERTYRRQPIRNRVLVASAGSIMHFVMAFVLAWVAPGAGGSAVGHGRRDRGVHPFSGLARTPAQSGGIGEGGPGPPR